MKQMKNSVLALLLLLGTSFSALGQAQLTTSKDLLGVWRLTKFYVANDWGESEPWCQGAQGILAYLPGQMFVSINCKATQPGPAAEALDGMLFYSGPFEYDSKTHEVIHRVRNFSHPSLNQVYRRKVEMRNPNHLRLVGKLGQGQWAIVEWERMERFSYNDDPLTGVWELVGSENEVSGSETKIPFCSGFYGLILYTPGGFNSVAINCGKKIDPEAVEPADQFGRKYFYSGTYELSGSVLTQTPLNASEVSQIGKPVIRFMKIEGDILTLEGTNGSKFKAQWRKRHSFVGME